MALVTNNGTPISDAYVSFSDSFGSSFSPSTALTNSTGWAISEIDLNTLNSGTDVVTAQASLTGYTSGAGSATISVAPYSNTQLAVTISLQNNEVAGGSEDVLSGTVYTVITVLETVAQVL